MAVDVNQFVRQTHTKSQYNCYVNYATDKNDKDEVMMKAHLALSIAKLDTSLGFGR